MENQIPPLNQLLSIIIYSDTTTLDGFRKSLGHPVFLTLGNLLIWVRNSPDSKVLLDFLPKIQDANKTTEVFRTLQCEAYYQCFKIMLGSLLKRSDGLYFGVQG